MRTLEQLIDVDDPGIALLREWAGAPGANSNVVLPPDPSSRDAALLRLQVTTQSLLGAVVYETGGLSVGDGRLRIFGSGAKRSFLRINEGCAAWTAGDCADVLLIADDTAGGLYALNGGRFGAHDLGKVFHLASDSTSWGSLDVGHTAFMRWCLTGDLSIVTEDCDRYPYPDAILDVGFDKVRSFYPCLWTREGRDGTPDARLVDADENLRLRIDLLGFDVAD